MKRMKHYRTSRFIGLLLLVAALPVAAYFITHSWTFFDEPESLGAQLAITITMIAILLAVPYWMLKLGSRAEREVDPKERELKLKDIPKDLDQLHGQN